ncbi:hypothetical protein JCM11491_005514 [Sporobolomyces phaffii]
MTSEDRAATSKPAAKVKPSNFCIQLHSLLENPRDPDNLRWVDGKVDQFQITVDEQAALAALRPTLDFKSMSSFVRQLSYYDFKRLSDRRKSNERRGEARCIIFTHHSGLFTRGNPANVEQMKRKLRIRAERGRRASAVSTGSVDDDHSQSGSPLFSPIGTTWTNEQPPPLPSPSFPNAFNMGMGSFSLSAPPPPRTISNASTPVEPPPQARWQPYNPPEAPYPPPAQTTHSPAPYEPPRYAPYPRAATNVDRRASTVSVATDASNLSPRSRSVELAYYAGNSARHSPSTLSPAEYSSGANLSFSNPFTNQAFPSPSAQPSQYFPSSRHPASPSTTPHPPNTIPTGLPTAFEHPSSQLPSVSNLSLAAESGYPPLSALNHYRPTLPNGFHYPNQQQHEPQRQDCGTASHPGFRNHLRFSSAPSQSQPPYPYPHFAPPQSEEYDSPTSVPDDDLTRRAALEARRTSYPFPPPLASHNPASAEPTPPSPYNPAQDHDHSVPSSGDQPDWTTSKQYYQPQLSIPRAPSAAPTGDSNHPPEWRNDHVPQYSQQGGASTGGPYYDAYAGTAGGGAPGGLHHHQGSNYQ